MDRRNFVNTVLAAGLGGSSALAQQSTGAGQSTSTSDVASKIPRVTDPGERRGEMLYRKLGKTGETVSAIGLGGSHIGRATLSDADAIKLIHSAIDRGITFMDNSWDYNEGRSERLMGQALSENGYRNKVFLMTKIDGRNKQIAMRQIEDSLSRLKTDHLDLLQHHEVLRYDDPDRIFGPGGSMEAMLDAKKAGKIRFMGFTGHKDPHIHLYMLDVAAKHDIHFDTAQMPLNAMDAHFRSFAQLVVPRLVQENMGVLGMKPFGAGVLLKSRTLQPIDYLHYTLNLPTSVVITGIDKPEILDQAFEAVKTFQPMDEAKLSALLSQTQQAAMNGEYELFKTTSHFDTTARHPDWLGADSPAVQELAPQLPG